MQKVLVEIPEGMSAEWANGVLTLIGSKDINDKRPITERIKTFEDACNEVGIDASEWIKDKEDLGLEKDVIAYMKLRIICKVLNEGWKPTLEKDEYRYFPWYYLYTQEQLDNMSEGEQQILKGRLLDCNTTDNKSVGFFYVSTNYAPAYMHANIGSYLCSKSKKLASYCGIQFIDIWFNFLFPDFKINNNWED